MIHARLVRLGYEALQRESFESFTRYKEARETADAEVAAILHEIEEQTGAKTPLPSQGEPDGKRHPLKPYALVLSLKRLAAWAEEGQTPPARFEQPDPTSDEKLAPYLARDKAPRRFPHFLLHAEASGYYVPLEFPRPFWLPETERSVGSAPALAREMESLTQIIESWKSEFPEELELAERLKELGKEACLKKLTVELSGDETPS